MHFYLAWESIQIPTIWLFFIKYLQLCFHKNACDLEEYI